ncbi:hypothetical protein [Salinicola tamaricis]|uniref:hypothetical protein n=1 Tax=Salinicola tamaricis TaxID=1771309 RepID=UPI003BF5AE6A
MTSQVHPLGYPRIGAHRELKRAVEAYWQGALDRDALGQMGKRLRLARWQDLRRPRCTW